MSDDTIAADANYLISKFLEKGSLQFADFIATWKELSFIEMLCIPSACGDKAIGNANTTLVELIHKLLQVGAKYMCNTEAGDPTRVAGLYLCYAIYYIQPLKLKVHIRLNLEGWENMEGFYSHLKAHKMFQPLYMLFYLKNDAAFKICYTSCQMYLSYRSKDNVFSQYQSCMPDPSTAAGLMSMQKELSSMSTEYDKLKEELSMFLPSHLLEPSNLPKELESTIRQYPTS